DRSAAQTDRGRHSFARVRRPDRRPARSILACMGQPTETSAPVRRGPEPPDLAEKGGIKEGQAQRSDRRLFMQFLAFGGCEGARLLADALARAGVAGVVYEDVNDPQGVGLLTF